MAKTATRRITLPQPLSHQLPILADPARFKLLACGRRWGKTVLSLIAMVVGHGPDRARMGALNGGNIWYIAPTYPMAGDTWRLLKRALGDVATAKNEQTMRLDLPGGGAITIKSADDPDGLRGVGLDGVVLDEAAFLDPRVWHEAIRPALADKLGWAILISTPCGQNWFYRTFREGQTRANWAVWQEPTASNPLIPAEEIESCRESLGSHGFAQEMLAAFVSPLGSRIRPEWFRYSRPNGAGWLLFSPDGDVVRTVPRSELRRFTVVDPAGSTADVRLEKRRKRPCYSVIMTCDVHIREGFLVVADVQRGLWDAPDLCHRIETSFRSHNPTWVGIEAVGIGLPIYQQMTRRPVPIKPLRPGGRDKVERATRALVMLEAGKIYHAEPSSGAGWVRAYEDELLMWTGHPDDVADQVDCLAYAAMEATSSTASKITAMHVAPRDRPSVRFQRTNKDGYSKVFL